MAESEKIKGHCGNCNAWHKDGKVGICDVWTIDGNFAYLMPWEYCSRFVIKEDQK
jgi:hypothetical protein